MGNVQGGELNTIMFLDCIEPNMPVQKDPEALWNEPFPVMIGEPDAIIELRTKAEIT